MTAPTILSHRTWTTTEPDPDDRHKLPVKITWTETVQVREMTDEERKALTNNPAIADGVAGRPPKR